MATKTFMGFDPDTGVPSEFEGKLARKTQKAIGNTEKAAFRSAMGIPAAAEGLVPSQNLADVDDVSASRDNLAVLSSTEVNDRQLSKAPSNGLDFTPSTATVEIPDSALLSFGDGTTDKPFSISAIVEIDDFSSQTFSIMSKMSGAYEWWFLVDTNGYPTVSLYDNGLTNTLVRENQSAVDTGKRLHLAATYDGSGLIGGLKLYVNAVEGSNYADQSVGSYVAMHDTAAQAEIGEGNNVHSDGRIYSCVIWNRELSASEVATLAANGNQVPVADQWGSNTELLTDPGFEDWSSGSNLSSWTEGSSITIAQDGVNKYSGTYACHYTSSGSTIASGVLHQLRQGSLVPIGCNRVSVVVKNAVSGVLDVGVNNDRWVTFDGTSLTDRSSEVSSQYPGSELLSYDLTDLGSGWYRIDLVFKLVASSARDFVLGGTGQWYIDDASCKPAGAVADYAFDAIDAVNGVLPDRSSNGLNGAITDATKVRADRGLHIDANNPSADEKLLTVSVAGTEKASIDEDGDAVVQRLNIANIPTSSGGLTSGDVWNDSGTLKIVT
jgi:hypothetical protein